ncbi:dTMP kinase [Flaviflexus salsibiostraticola]|uniref:Thymidylate kinase n=1 Tax=Flaviflexus salsibiostraticola TaxID=1282737 RepID=A0A3Q8WW00_9ACTO|nr:dTMP kinase [Flaviflexus salsibiostraticola]AZN30458.1 dTMP kinase [Flaviflexus salsibiostraticola]
MTGLFISFEGGDGTGKTTQIARLAEHLRAEGAEVVTTREPGGTELGREIRQALLHGEDLSPRTEALLYSADRAHHVATVIRPALDRGATVITDRFVDSSVAYQGSARELGIDEIRSLNDWAVGGLVPDLTFLLDLDPAVGAARLNREKDRLESAGDDFHRQVRQTFLEMAEAEPDRFVVIDASRSIDEIAADVRAGYERLR